MEVFVRDLKANTQGIGAGPGIESRPAKWAAVLAWCNIEVQKRKSAVDIGVFGSWKLAGGVLLL